jgi:hypothetical protein
MKVLRQALTIVLLLGTTALAKSSRQDHPDYVPDQKTAERIAEAVLVARYGEQQIKAQSPLLVDGSNKEYWIVQVSGGPGARPTPGGGPAVWINKHSGCLTVMDHMK